MFKLFKFFKRDIAIIIGVDLLALSTLVPIWLSLREYGMFNTSPMLEKIAYPFFWLFTNKVQSAGEHTWFFDFYGVGWMLAIVVCNIIFILLTIVARKLYKDGKFSVRHGVLIASMLYAFWGINYIWVGAFPDIQTGSFKKYNEHKLDRIDSLSQPESGARYMLALKLHNVGKTKEAYGADLVFTLVSEVKNKKKDEPSSLWTKRMFEMHQQYAFEFPVLRS